MRNLVARTAVGTMFLAVLFCGGGPICAELITFIGVDPSAGPGQSRPNSDAAAARFDVAAASFGDVNPIDFESAPLGEFSSLMAAPGVTVTRANSGTFSGVVTTPSNSLSGYNTTPGGERYLRASPITVFPTFTFTFDEPIQAFGTYLTGMPNGTPIPLFDGTLQIAYADGTSRSLSLPPLGQSGGVSFFGFLDTEAPISEVTLRAGTGSRNPGTLSVDDVRYVTAVPEPSTLVLWGIATTALMAFAWRQRSQADGQCTGSSSPSNQSPYL